jgi:amino acid adenylation domain-containing protein
MSAYLLQHLLKESAARRPEQIAVMIKDRSLTYHDLEKRSSQLASALVRIGVRKGDRVGIVFLKSIESIIALFSVLKAGASYVPIDPMAPISRAKYIISNCGIECLLMSKERAVRLLPDLCKDSPLKKVLISEGPSEELDGQCKTLELVSWEELFQNEPRNRLFQDITDNYPAYILYTSGSTGMPKGVIISHLNSLTFVNMASNFFKIDNNDRFVNHAPLHFDLSVFDIFVAIKNGATIVLIPEYFSIFPKKLAEYIAEKQISIWNSVSSVLSLLAERGKLERFRFDSLRIVLFSGDIFPVKYLRRIKARMPTAEFFNLYGQTEANSSTFYQISKIQDEDTWRIPIGKAFPNFEIFALNENNEPIDSPGVEGELYVRGSTVAMGYWADAQRSAASFVPDPLYPYSPNMVYKTGDIVRLDVDGNFVFVGRKDHLVKSRGYRIQTNEIEIALSGCPAVEKAAVVTVPDEVIGNRIIAYVSLIEGAKVQESEILNYCAEKIPKYMIPETVECIDKFPTISTGKIDRKALSKEALAKYVALSSLG